MGTGQPENSPCVNAGSVPAVSLGLNKYTTRTDGVTDRDLVDMGYHYGYVGLLTRIDLISPDFNEYLASPPSFAWSVDGGTNNIYAIDLAYSKQGPFYSTWKDLGIAISNTSWTMSTSTWNQVPSGSKIFWRVRGLDLDVPDAPVVKSYSVYHFYKL
jgi:hypothetical protein